MKFLLWFVLIVLGISLFFRVFGPYILKWMIRLLARQAQKNMDAQSRNYQRRTEDANPFEQNVYVNDDIKVSIPRGFNEKKKEKQKFDPNSVEDVDYEDLNP